MSDTESKEVSTDEPAASTAQGTQNDTGSDFLTDAEQEVLQDWLVYVAGLFAVVGLAMGLQMNIQDQWDHSLFDVSSGATGTPGVTYSMVILVGIISLTFFGAVIARNVDNSNNTAYKVAAATALVAMPILYLVSGFTILIPFDNVSLEFVNVIVSGLGSGIAAAISSAIVVYLTDEQAPDALSA